MNVLEFFGLEQAIAYFKLSLDIQVSEALDPHSYSCTDYPAYFLTSELHITVLQSTYLVSRVFYLLDMMIIRGNEPCY